nr:YkgJ family cysteine cluster protein [uncultured Carboxylicivirga sp.]
MNIVQVVRGVEKLFESLEKDIHKMQKHTGIHCVENCIHCCTTTKIEATAIEFLPLAYHLYKTGRYKEVLAKIDQLNNEFACPLLNVLSHEGSKTGCTFYPYRGLICRLFSYNYVTSKYGVKKINACKTIRLNQPLEVDKANQLLLTKTICPKASDYYSRLLFIHFNEARNLYPIGTAIRIAIDMVLTYMSYKGKKVM